MPQSGLPSQREAFLDNLRTAMIFLVVLYHAGIVYESSGMFASFWIVDDPATNHVAGLLNVVIDVFALPVLFFVSGYLAPRSVVRHTGGRFLVHRARRLLLPWLAAVLVLMPAYKVIFLWSRHLPQESWTTYFHFTNGFLSQSWLWFLPVLFVFDAVFWLLARLRVRPPAISLPAGVTGAVVVSVAYSLALSLAGMTGWTKTPLLDFQNERLVPYFLVFLLGALCFRLGVFDRPPRASRLYVAVSATVWIPLLAYMVVLLQLLLKPGQFFVSLPVDLVMLWVGFYVSVFAMLYLTVSTFRRGGRGEGPLGNWLSGGSFGVYVIHVPVLGAIALMMLEAGIPSLAKYGLLATTTYVVSQALVHAWKRLAPPKAVTAGPIEAGIA